ncbi:MAG: SGNH/GDSL hydrolase family protein [Clostridia bacterium]|nr:SGNH/GDSL hydrolase family protein [Clostridia bacterium]
MNQIEKNTVKADNQLKPNEFVSFDNEQNSGLRIMFMGNSITLHGIKHDIGWHNHWGMAASAKEKDYVHIIEKEVKKIHSDATFCICQVANWERGYKNGKELYSLYEPARDFGADIIIARLIENCPYVDFDADVFKTEYLNLIKYLSKSDTKVILTTGFWKHTGDEAIRELGKENGIPVVELGDLGEDESMKAIGLFEHSGVANHPGDKGMKYIANRIFTELKTIL